MPIRRLHAGGLFFIIASRANGKRANEPTTDTMTLKKGQLIDLEVSQIAYGGKGIARYEGMAVFVDQAVPQDRVRARIVKKKKSYAEARIAELLQASPQRVPALCPYSGVCGGCKWQFLGYPHQIVYKQQHVRESLEHIALVKDFPVHPTIGSEKVFGYRNKMEFTCSTRRWLLPEELGRDDVPAGMALGLHVPGTFDKVLDIKACLLQPDLGNAILSDVRDFIKRSTLPVYGLRSHEGFWRFLVLRHSVAHDQWMVNIVTAAEAREHVQLLADLLKEKYPGIVSVVNNITGRPAGVAVGEYELQLAGQPTLLERIGSFEFELSANSFFQTNTRGAGRLYETVKQYADLQGGETVLDLYCGTGTIAIYLAAAARRVVGVEAVEAAVADAQRNCRRNGIDNCRFITGDVRFTLPQLDVRPDVMIIDPPRSGMHADVVKQVMDRKPPRIVYVSCNPATMARDLLLLKEIYSVMEVQPVDMFPHTYHVEAVARLIRKAQ
jgi:23S rRNA (uracil1939-C5)-methyltransferase